MKVFSTIIFTILFLLIYNNSYSGDYVKKLVSGGSGNGFNNPYLISDAEDIDSLMCRVSDWNKIFVLINDINCLGYTWSINNPSPIGNSGTPFSGNFDGDNHLISNISINKPTNDDIGFFGQINGGYVANLRLYNINVVGRYSTGVLSGSIEFYSIVSNCYAYGIVTGYINVGVFCGSNWGNTTITNSFSSGYASGDRYIGGFVGTNLANARINNCSSKSNVSGNGFMGCFSGGNDYYGIIYNCFSSGIVSGTYFIGGFCGIADNSATIYNCYSSGSSSGSDGIGGFIGLNRYTTLTNCYSYGNSIGTNYVGGFCGYSMGNINNCYSIGQPSFNTTGTNLGGFIGFYESGSLNCDFWGYPRYELNDIGNLGDVSDSQVKLLNYFDFAVQSNFSCLDFPNIWMMSEHRPILTNMGDLQKAIPTLSEWVTIIFIALFSIIGGLSALKRCM